LSSVKHQLYQLCLDYVKLRIAAAQEAIQQAQLSANEETKSAAGDKYETGRAMAQLEIEKNSVQLAEAQKLKQALEQISPDQSSSTIQTGSLVITNQGNYYITISAGQLVLDSTAYFVVSPVSPIAKHMMGLKLHTPFQFQGRNFTILEIL
jgi:hypothetical protein